MDMETLYFRDDSHLINGLTAYKLISTQGSSGASAQQDLGSGTRKHYWGIRVWIRHADSSEDELTNLNPVAIVTRDSNGSGIQSNIWKCPNTTILATDAIRVRVYGKFEGFSWYELTGALYYGWITTQLGALGSETTLTGTWTIYYWTEFQYPVGADTQTWFKWGDSTWNSRIEDMERIEVYSGGPYVTVGTIDTYDPDNDEIKNTLRPINLPYERVSENIQSVIDRMVTSTFVPWEWWFTHAGQLRVAETRGTDKSASINVQAANEIGGSVKETSSKQTAQRIRVVGRGESGDQDEVTSMWQTDEDEIVNVNSFYEKIFSEKGISNVGVLDTDNNLTEADIWAKILLAQYAPLTEEVTVRLENTPFVINSSSGDFDVGDIITVTDPATRLSGSYRIKTLRKTVDSNGETITLTCTTRRKDITDRLADMQKQINRLLTSSTFMDRFFGEGSKQKKIKADDVEDIWQQTASNKYATELPEEDTADVNLEECDVSGGIDIDCQKDEFYVNCNANSMGYVFLTEPLLKFSRDPRFTCEFEIDTNVGDSWAEDDYAYIRIWQVDSTGGWCSFPWGDGGFGFRIIKTTGSIYQLRAYLNDGVDNPEVTICNTVNEDVKYIIEARMEWKEKVVKFYFGKSDVAEDDPTWGFRLRAILPIALTANDTGNLAPFHITIDSRHAPNTQALQLYIYRWRTQAIRAVES